MFKKVTEQRVHKIYCYPLHLSYWCLILTDTVQGI